MAKTLRKIENICRLCLVEDGKQLVPAAELINDSLSVEDIERFTGIQIPQDEYVSYAICVDCREKLKSSKVFRTLCMTNDALFRQLFALLVEGVSSKAGPRIDGTGDVCELQEQCMGSRSVELSSDIEVLDTTDETRCLRVEYVFQESVLVPDEQYDYRSNDALEDNDKNDNRELHSHVSNDDLDDPEGSKRHLEPTRHHQERNFSCPYCSLQMTLKSNLQQHIQTVHLKNNSSKTCSLCGETFSSYQAYNYHKVSQHDTRGYETECTICSKKFPNITAYNEHCKHHHATGDEKNGPKARKKQLCGECGLMVTGLSAHILTHSQEKQLACPHCPVKMVDKGNLSRHIQAVHLKKVVRTCEPCGREFLHVNLYKYHMLSVHRIGKTFDCDICVKKFNTLAGLKIHKISLHTNEKRFECGTCGMMFKLKHTLRTHEKRVHSEEKPFACGQCPKRFKSPYGKKSHELTHSGQVFACTTCDKSYRYKSLLQRHTKKQHSSLGEVGMEH